MASHSSFHCPTSGTARGNTWKHTYDRCASYTWTSGAWPHNYVLIIIIWNDAALGFTELVSICFHYNYPQSIASLLKITNSEFLIKLTLCPIPTPLDSAAVTAFLASSPPPPCPDSSATQKTGRQQTSQGAAESSGQRQPGRACLWLRGAMLLASQSPLRQG